jgi:hypothetical protein
MHGATVSVATSAPLVAVGRPPLMTRLRLPLSVALSDPAVGSGALRELALLSTEFSKVWWLEMGVRELDIDFMV